MVLATALVAGWAVSWWIVPPYVALMAWLLMPADDRTRAGEPARTEPLPTEPNVAVEPTLATVESSAEDTDRPSTSTAIPKPTRARKSRSRSKSRDRESSPIAHEPMTVNWVQVAPGKFLRVESPQAPSSQESVSETVRTEIEPETPWNDGAERPPDPPPDDVGIAPDRDPEPDLNRDDGEPAGFDPPIRPDETVETTPAEAPDHDDPGPDDDPDPKFGPESRTEPHDEHLGFAEVRELGGEDAAITPTEPVGACPAQPGPNAEDSPTGETSACPTDESPGVAGIAPDASGKPAERPLARPTAPTMLPLRVDGWPGGLSGDRTGRTRGPIADNPPLPTPGLDRGRFPGPGRPHGRHRHDRPFHPAAPGGKPRSRGPPQ